jgi:hypothetical protein
MTLKPAGRTLQEFEASYVHTDGKPLWPAERKLLEAARTGEVCNLQRPAQAGRPVASTPDNQIRPRFLRFLILGGDENAPVHEKGIRLQGAWIDGQFDLEAVQTTLSVYVWNCVIQGDVVLRDARLTTFALDGSTANSVWADRISTTGGLFLRNGFFSIGEVRLLGARIGGNIACSGGMFNGNGNALSCDQAKIVGSVFLDGRFAAAGAVRLPGAEIGGDLDCKSGAFNGTGDSLLCDRAEITGNVFLNDGFTAAGQVRLLGAKVGGDLACRGGTFNCTGNALSCDRAKITGSVFLNSGFTAAGEVRLLGAEIGGDVDCMGGTFNGHGTSLRCDGAIVNGTVHLSKFFRSLGRVTFFGAEIHGDMNCAGGFFGSNKSHLDFDDNLESVGLSGLEVRGAFSTIRSKAPAAKFADSARMRSMSVKLLIDMPTSWPETIDVDELRYESIAESSLGTAAERIAWLDKNNPHLPFSPKPWEHLIRVLRESGHEDMAREIAIAKEDRLRKDTRIRKRSGVKDIIHQWPITWAHALFGLLAGYGYRPFRLVAVMASVWLACAAWFLVAAEQGVFAPSNPLVFNNPELAAACNPPDPARAWPGLGTGDLPARISDEGPPVQLDALARPTTRNWYLCEKLPAAYTTFDALLYSLDLLLPLVELQQNKDWAPMVCTPEGLRRDRDWFGAWLESVLMRNDSGVCQLRSVTRFVMWFEIIFGWVASLMLVAAVTRLAAREKA